MTAVHNHDLDGKLWEDCPACDDIRSRAPGVKRERAADQMAEQFRRKAERAPRRRPRRERR